MEKQKISTVFKWLSLGAAAVAALLQTIAMLLSYDPEANYFLIGAPLPYLAAAFAILGALLGVVCAVLAGPARTATPFRGNVLPAIPAALGMLAFPFLSGGFTGGTLSLIASVMLILAAAYTVLCETTVRKSSPDAVCVLGFTSILACALTNATYYFDPSLEMNAPVKVVLQTALLFIMLYYTAELRYLMGRELPKLYIALSLIAVSVSALASVAVAVAFFCGILTRIDALAGALLVLGIAITVLLRLFRVLSEKKSKLPPAQQITFTTSYGSEANDNK